MSEKTGERPRELVPVPDIEARGFLEEACKTFASAMIWTKGAQGTEDRAPVLHTQLTHLSEPENTLYALVPKGEDPARFLDAAAKSGEECFFSVSLVRANVFFKARVSGARRNQIHFLLPEKVYKVQRRADLRLVIPEPYVLKVEFQDPLFSESRLVKKLFDISASGCSFVVPPEEEVVYQTGLVLKRMTLHVRGRSIEVDGEVRHARRMPDRSRVAGSKIGIHFRNIRPGDAQHVAAYVFEESRRFYSKFL